MKRFVILPVLTLAITSFVGCDDNSPTRSQLNTGLGNTASLPDGFGIPTPGNGLRLRGTIVRVENAQETPEYASLPGNVGFVIHVDDPTDLDHEGRPFAVTSETLISDVEDQGVSATALAVGQEIQIQFSRNDNVFQDFETGSRGATVAKEIEIIKNP